MLNDINFQLFSSKGEIHFQILDACTLFCMKYIMCLLWKYVICISVTIIQFYITDFHWSYKEKTYLNKDDIKCV